MYRLVDGVVAAAQRIVAHLQQCLEQGLELNRSWWFRGFTLICRVAAIAVEQPEVDQLVWMERFREEEERRRKEEDILFFCCLECKGKV